MSEAESSQGVDGFSNWMHQTTYMRSVKGTSMEIER